MKVSLVLVSSGRDLELLDFLKSLIFQTYKNFELIVVDQNHDSDVDRILQTFAGCLDIRHVKVTFTGTALARDYGIALTKGDIIAFPDDDCVYDKRVLEQVVLEFARRRKMAILAAGSYDFSDTRFSSGVNRRRPGYFSRLNMMGAEFTQFFALDRVDKQQFYLDPDFGVGSKYAGAEGFELLYRLLRAGNKAFYTPKIKIYRASKAQRCQGEAAVLEYSTGIGAYIRKFANQRDFFVSFYILQKTLMAQGCKVLLAAVTLDANKLAYSFDSLVGVWRGFLDYGRTSA